MNLFFSEDIRENFIYLDPEESNHCIRVLRMKKGDPAMATNGRGEMFQCIVAGDDPRGCKLEIMNAKADLQQTNFHLHIAIAPTKNSDRYEWFLEKVTEIGIHEITPVFCAHSERKKLNHERGRKVVISAMKQSQKSLLPILNASCSLDDILSKEIGGMKFIAWCETGKERSLQSLYRKGSDVTILIGPEGDFSPGEVRSAQDAGWIPVSLGRSRLRTETAGIVACHTINLINES